MIHIFPQVIHIFHKRFIFLRSWKVSLLYLLWFLATVRTTRDAKAFKQDAGLWKDRILELMDEKAAAAAFDRAQLLKMALKSDEVTIQTHDNLVAYCLRTLCLLKAMISRSTV